MVHVLFFYIGTDIGCKNSFIGKRRTFITLYGLHSSCMKQQIHYSVISFIIAERNYATYSRIHMVVF